MKTLIVSSSDSQVAGQTKLAAHVRGLVRKYLKEKKGKLITYLFKNGQWKYMKQVISVDVVKGDLIVRAENARHEVFTLTVKAVLIETPKRVVAKVSESVATADASLRTSWASESWFVKHNQPIPKYAYYYHAYGR